MKPKQELAQIVGKKGGAERLRLCSGQAEIAVPLWRSIWATLAMGIALLTMADPSPALGALGGDVTSVESDRAKMEASLRTTSKQLYTIHEIQAPNNVVVREFVSPAGKVFGVAWQGPSRPDMRQLLGAYFDQFNEAAKNQQAQRVGRGPLIIQQPGFVLQMGGHARSFSGRAYIPQMVPAGVQIEELR
jgi:Protein of unknown function (DUF2844)